MISRWDRGRDEIDGLIHRGRLTRVAANHDLALSHLDQASTHLTAAATLRDLEPPRQREIREFDWMRRLRNETQYPDVDRNSASSDDVDQAIPAARAIVERATQLVESMPPY